MASQSEAFVLRTRYHYAIISVVLALKDQLSRLTAIRAEYRTLRAALQFAEASWGEQNGLLPMGRLLPPLLDQLATLANVGSEIHEDLSVSEIVLAETTPYGETEHGAQPSPIAVADLDELDVIVSLARSHPRHVAEVLVRAAPDGGDDERALLEEACALLRGIGKGQLAEIDNRETSSPDRLASSLRHIRQRLTSINHSQLLEEVADLARGAIRRRAHTLLLGVDAVGQDLPLGGLPPLADLLMRLASHEQTLDAAIGMLDTLRRGADRQLETLPPTYPRLPRSSLEDRDRIHSKVESLINTASRRVSHLVESIVRPELGPAEPRDISICFTDILKSEVRASGPHIALRMPHIASSKPRVAIDLLHEVAHALLPRGPLDEVMGPRVVPVLRRLRFQHERVHSRRGLALDHNARADLERRIEELIVDVVALASAGPMFAAALLLSLIARNPWSSSPLSLAGEPIMRAAALWHGWRRHTSWSPSDAKGDSDDPLVWLDRVFDGLCEVHRLELERLLNGVDRESLVPVDRSGVHAQLAEVATLQAWADASAELLAAMQPHGGGGPSEGLDIKRYHEFSDTFLNEAVLESEKPGAGFAGPVGTRRWRFPSYSVEAAHVPSFSEEDPSGAPRARDACLTLSLLWQTWLGVHITNQIAGRWSRVCMELLHELPLFLALTYLYRRPIEPNSIRQHQNQGLWRGRWYRVITIDTHWQEPSHTSIVSGLCSAGKGEATWMVLGVADILMLREIPGIAHLAREVEESEPMPWLRMPHIVHEQTWCWVDTDVPLLGDRSGLCAVVELLPTKATDTGRLANLDGWNWFRKVCEDSSGLLDAPSLIRGFRWSSFLSWVTLDRGRPAEALAHLNEAWAEHVGRGTIVTTLMTPMPKEPTDLRLGETPIVSAMETLMRAVTLHRSGLLLIIESRIWVSRNAKGFVAGLSEVRRQLVAIQRDFPSLRADVNSAFGSHDVTLRLSIPSFRVDSQGPPDPFGEFLFGWTTAVRTLLKGYEVVTTLGVSHGAT